MNIGWGWRGLNGLQPRLVAGVFGEASPFATSPSLAALAAARRGNFFTSLSASIAHSDIGDSLNVLYQLKESQEIQPSSSILHTKTLIYFILFLNFVNTLVGFIKNLN
jgi:hypothetical protein